MASRRPTEPSEGYRTGYLKLRSVLHDRATGYRQSISLHGVGHGDFHNGGGSSVASGPCLVGRANTHRIMKGYLLPMLELYIRDNAAGMSGFNLSNGLSVTFAP